jgi:hypothetical protein
MDGTGELHFKQNKPSSKTSKVSCFLPYVEANWTYKLNIYINIYDYIYIHIYIDRENKNVLLSLSEGLWEVGNRKCYRMKNIQTIHLYMNIMCYTVNYWILGQHGDRESVRGEWGSRVNLL